MKTARGILVATVLAACAAEIGVAQTADDLETIFPAEGWTVATIAGRVEVDCIATFDRADGVTIGYDVTFATGARTGEFHFDWRGDRQRIAYTLGPAIAGLGARTFTIRWSDERGETLQTAADQLDLAAALALIADEMPERPLAAALEFVWADRFCRNRRLAMASLT